jgi:photosystem II stability/assembly factor-like uncharacterized protein
MTADVPSDVERQAGGSTWSEVYREQRDGLVRLAYLVSGSQAVAEDLVQDTFLRVMAKLDPADKPGPYLRRSVVNACYSWHRRHGREVPETGDEYLESRPEGARVETAHRLGPALLPRHDGIRRGRHAGLPGGHGQVHLAPGPRRSKEDARAMNDDELIKSLEQTLRSRAESITPSAMAVPSLLRAARRPASRRRLALISLATAAAAVVVGLVATGGSGRANRISVLSPSSTTPASTAPAATTTPRSAQTAPPSTASPPTSQVPAGFQPVSVTFVSQRTGWVLGAVPCSQGSCAAVAETRDGGMSWTSQGAPPVALPGGAGTGGAGGPASSAGFIRFANLLDGWIVAPAAQSASGGSLVWYTPDGGRTWSGIANPGGANATVEDIEASDGVAHMVVLSQSGVGGSGPGMVVFTTPVGQNAWTESPVSIPVGGGPVPSAQLVLQGPSGWIVENDRTVVGGAELAGRAWTPWTPPCTKINGPAVLAASSPSSLVALCFQWLWGGPPGTTPTEYLYTSSDGGANFTQAGRVPFQDATVTAASQPAGTPSTVVLAVSGGRVGFLDSTFDGGRTWQLVYKTLGTVDFVGFTTAAQGVAIASASASGPSEMLMTFDGGHNWAPVKF